MLQKTIARKVRTNIECVPSFDRRPEIISGLSSKTVTKICGRNLKKVAEWFLSSKVDIKNRKELSLKNLFL